MNIGLIFKEKEGYQRVKIIDKVYCHIEKCYDIVYLDKNRDALSLYDYIFCEFFELLE